MFEVHAFHGDKNGILNKAAKRKLATVRTAAHPAPDSDAGAALQKGLAVFSLPSTHRRRMRTSNAIEWVNQENKRRTRVASIGFRASDPGETKKARSLRAQMLAIICRRAATP